MFLQDQTLRIYCQHQQNQKSIQAVIDYLSSKHDEYRVSWFRSIENLVFLYGGLFDEEGKIKRITRLVGVIREILPNLELILESLLYNLALVIQIALRYPNQTRGFLAKADDHLDQILNDIEVEDSSCHHIKRGVQQLRRFCSINGFFNV